MNIICPVCASVFPLQAALNDKAAREAIVRAFELTEIGSLLLAYVQLFKPAKSALSMARTAKLLDELVPMIKSGQVERNGRAWPAPQAYWRQALEHMSLQRNSLTLPLKSHGYLFEIIVGFANKAEAKQEAKAEQGRIYGREDNPQPSPLAPLPKGEGNKERRARSEMPAEVRQTLRKLTNRKD